MLGSALPATVDLDLNDLYSTLVTYLLSRQKQERCLLCLKDIGSEEAQSSDQEITSLLKKFAIEPDQLLLQSEQKHRYQHFAHTLLSQQKAFACLCVCETPQTLSQDSLCQNSCFEHKETVAQQIKAQKQPYVIRIKKAEKEISFVDLIRGEISVAPERIGTPVLLQDDGNPSPLFASACDDILSGTSVRIRTMHRFDSTPGEIHIKQSLGYTAQTDYIHLPALSMEGAGDDDTPLSIRVLLEEGFLPDTIINYLLLIGNTAPTEHFTLPDAVAWFDLSTFSTDPVIFNKETLRRLNRRHLEAMDDRALSMLFGFADTDIGRLLKLYLEEADTITALEHRIKAIFSPKHCDGDAVEQMQILSALIYEAPMLDTFEDFMQYLTTHSGMEEAQLLTLLRLLITATPNGPRLEDIYPLISPYITEIARCTP